MKYALCIESIFPGVDHREQIDLVLQAGYSAVEVWSIDEARRKILIEARNKGVETAMIVGAAHFVTQDCHHIQAQLESLKRSVDLAHDLHCPNICLFAGRRNPAMTFDGSRDAVKGFLGQAAEILEGSGISGIVESLSPDHHPDGFLLNMRETIAILKEVNRPEIRLQFDIFHTAMTDSNFRELLRECMPLISYFQAADAPSRGEPGTGLLDFRSLISDIRKSGFSGFFSWEFFPLKDPCHALRDTKAIELEALKEFSS